MADLDLAAQIQVLREEFGVVVLDREVVMARGDAVVDYLQGQLSQEVAALEPGRAAWTFVLQPQGKVDAWFRITRLDSTTFLLDVDAGWATSLIERLERFRLRTAVTFEVVDWSVVAVRGAKAPPPAPPTDPALGVVVPVEWPGDRGWDLIAERSAIDVPAGAPMCSPEAIDVLRIEAGVPKMGAELDQSTIPAEVGVVPISVSFTKGCYTGQELVARIDSRGSQTPRRLVGLRIDGDVPPAPGDRVLTGDGTEVGRVTSVAPVSSFGTPVALATLARAAAVPLDVEIHGAHEPIAARAVVVPMVSLGQA